MKEYVRQWLATEGKEWAWSIGVSLFLVFGIVRPFIVQAYKIPSGSMIPTLQIGDKLFVNKYTYRFHAPKNGDIAVFLFPDPDKSHPKKDYIKRLVASEGETVEIRNGKIYLNDRPLTDPATFGKFYYYNHGPYADPGQEITVPKDSYFALGDNSANSTDGRFWGFVPKKNMIGKAVFRWWPPNRMGRVS